MSRKPARYVSFLAHGNRHRIAIQLNKKDLQTNFKLVKVEGDWEDSYITIMVAPYTPGGRAACFRPKHDMLFVESVIDDVPSIKRFLNKFFYVTGVEYASETGEYVIRLKYHRDATQVTRVKNHRDGTHVTRVKNQEVSLVQMEPAEFLSPPPVPTELLPDILQAIRKINDYQRAQQTPLELSITDAGLIKVAVEM